MIEGTRTMLEYMINHQLAANDRRMVTLQGHLSYAMKYYMNAHAYAAKSTLFYFLSSLVPLTAARRDLCDEVAARGDPEEERRKEIIRQLLQEQKRWEMEEEARREEIRRVLLADQDFLIRERQELKEEIDKARLTLHNQRTEDLRLGIRGLRTSMFLFKLKTLLVEYEDLLGTNHQANRREWMIEMGQMIHRLAEVNLNVESRFWRM
jgi:hypothetical protein